MAESGRQIGRTAGILGAAVGVVAAGAAVGLAVERYVVGRPLRRITHIHDAGEPLGTLRGTPRPVTTSDGVDLAVEVDGKPDAPLTLVFVHGYALAQDSFHFQRAEFADDYRLVFYDQRSHGRSGRAPAGSSTIPRIGEDLYEVLQATAPTGPVVLVGHSMGGMAVLALACSHPEIFGPRVIGVALIGTSAGRFQTITLGMPAITARALHRVAGGALSLLARQPGLVDRSRRAGTDLAYLLTRRFSFASDVPPAVAQFTAEMIEATPIDVIAEFFPAFGLHDSSGGMPVLGRVSTLVLVGDSDLLAPPSHSTAIAEGVPDAELVIVPKAGHVVIMEHPEVVNHHLHELIVRAVRAAGTTEGKPVVDD